MIHLFHQVGANAHDPLALWEYQSKHDGELPDNEGHAAELQAVANSMLSSAGVNTQAIVAVSQELTQYALL